MLRIVPIVEGHGEIEAVPVLLKRIAKHLGITIAVNPPIRVRASSFLKFDGEFQKHVKLATYKARNEGGIVLVLLDCEDHCPAVRGPEIKAQVASLADDIDVIVALAYREYETWFIYSLESLQEAQLLRSDLKGHPEPEDIRDAKGWLNEGMSTKYRETEHQLIFSRHLSVNAAMRSPSFRRLVEKLGSARPA